MLKKFIHNWHDRNDEKRLAAHQERDAELGTPSKERLNQRARAAAESGYWKTALAAIDAGADINQPLESAWHHRGNAGIYHFEHKISLAMLALEQNNTGALSALLSRGADRDFVATHTTNGTVRRQSLAEFAALNGQPESLKILIEAGVAQPNLDAALAIAAKEKKYLPLVAQLLDAGAKGYEPALFAAEKENNKEAIRLIKAARTKKPEGLPDAKSDERLNALAAIIESAPPQERARLIKGLAEKFAAANDGANATQNGASVHAHKTALRP
ncbi:MAG TPA: hypothetical protein VEF76_14765 [Patescibacteria group bacterium]|nr:hypothetical protein [Patescibacteria group bacterium]